MEPAIATSDAEIMACFPILKTLRLHLDEASFVHRVRGQEAAGYRLLSVGAGDAPEAVAGFRVGENLAWGSFLYVDDLVTLPAARSRGHGATLLRWLREYARREGCGALHLDSGVQRLDAHRFYEREGMACASFHFAIELA